MRRIALVWAGIGIVIMLGGCGIGRSGADDTNAVSTIAAYETQVFELGTEQGRLETEVAALQDALPVFQSSGQFGEPRPTETPEATFASMWNIEVSSVEEFTEYPDFDERSDRVSVTARGRIVAIRLSVSNITNQPIHFFSGLSLVLEDSQGRIYSQDVDATSSYVVLQTDIFDWSEPQKTDHLQSQLF